MTAEAIANVESRIRDLAQSCLVDDHKLDGVRFVDQLLVLAAEIGQLECTMAGDHGVRFQVSGQPAWEVSISRAKAKFRMLLARFAVLCMERGDKDLTIYGGKGIIEGGEAGQLAQSLLGKSNARWSIRFMNTPGRQELKIGLL